MIMAAPVTDKEREEIRIGREMDAQRRAGPFWTGTKQQIAEYEASLGKGGEGFDAFNGAATYGNKHTKALWQPPNLKKVKLRRALFYTSLR